jgi:hypothetical protein
MRRNKGFRVHGNGVCCSSGKVDVVD